MDYYEYYGKDLPMLVQYCIENDLALNASCINYLIDSGECDLVKKLLQCSWCDWTFDDYEFEQSLEEVDKDFVLWCYNFRLLIPDDEDEREYIQQLLRAKKLKT